MKTINIKDKYSQIREYWSPAIIADLNDNHVKLARIKDEFIWHKHEHEDEMFLVIEGTLHMKFRDSEEVITEGEMIVVPKGVEHLPYTKGEEVKIMLIEPRNTVNTGDVDSERRKENLKRI